MASGDTLGRRVLSAAILIPLVVALAMVGGWAFQALVAVAVVVMAIEWAGLMAARFGPAPGRLAGGLVMVVVLVAMLLFALDWREAALGLVLLGALAGALLAWRLVGPPLWTAVGVGWVGLPVLALLWLRALPELGLSALLWLLVVVWSTDTAAYIAGRGLGGPRLAPTISPGKTWSGLLGGMLGAALAGAISAWAIGAWAIDSGRWLLAAALGAMLAVMAQLGDLFQSALKRRSGVKDSGHLIPGHGGVLDRVDGLLFAAPALAVLSLWLGPEAWPWR